MKITTIEIAERFSKSHRNVTRAVRRCIDSIGCEDLSGELFREIEFKNEMNRAYRGYEMDANGFHLVSDTWGFSRGKAATVKSQILNELGSDSVVVSSLRTRFEDDFSDILKKFMHKHTIIREFYLRGFRVDFFIGRLSLVIEYDEEQHLSKAHKKADEMRDSEIMKELGLHVIRIKKGYEIEGLARIAGFMALSHNAIEMTQYYE